MSKFIFEDDVPEEPQLATFENVKPGDTVRSGDNYYVVCKCRTKVLDTNLQLYSLTCYNFYHTNKKVKSIEV